MAAKIHSVTKSMKEVECTKCHDTIPVGSPYQYFKPGYRGRLKVRRCMKPACTPKRSELDTSKLAEVFAAQEDAEATINEATEIPEIVTAVEAVKEEAERIQQEYQDAVDAAPMMNGQMEERMSALDTYVNELEGFDAGETEELGDDPDDEAQAEYEAALNQVRDEALDLIGSFEF
jgi:hypothetical protein